MSISERVHSILTNKINNQQTHSLMSGDGAQDFPIKQCKQKLFSLIVKLQKQKSVSKNQFPVQIRKRIFIGNFIFASEQNFIQQQNIGLIISCMTSSPGKIYQGIKYHKVPLKDQQGENITKYEQRVFQIIEQHLQTTQTNIYIHCFQGRSRSTAVFLMYLIRKQKRGLDSLINQLKNIYPSTAPNSWFLKDLKTYQQQLGLNALNEISKETQIKSSNKKQNQEDLLEINQIKNQTQQNLIELDEQRQHLLIPEEQRSPILQPEYHQISISDDQQDNKKQKTVQNFDLI